MTSPENQPVPAVAAVDGNDKKLRGREAVPVDKALAAQEDLIWYMTPPVILERIHNERQGNLLEALTLRYINKYVNDDLNGFADYCNLHADGETFIDRVNNGELTTDDFEKMKQFLEYSSNGSVFFGSAEEIENFIKEYTQSGN